MWARPPHCRFYLSYCRQRSRRYRRAAGARCALPPAPEAPPWLPAPLDLLSRCCRRCRTLDRHLRRRARSSHVAASTAGGQCPLPEPDAAPREPAAAPRRALAAQAGVKDPAVLAAIVARPVPAAQVAVKGPAAPATAARPVQAVPGARAEPQGLAGAPHRAPAAQAVAARARAAVAQVEATVRRPHQVPLGARRQARSRAARIRRPATSSAPTQGGRR